MNIPSVRVCHKADWIHYGVCCSDVWARLIKGVGLPKTMISRYQSHDCCLHTAACNPAFFTCQESLSCEAVSRDFQCVGRYVGNSDDAVGGSGPCHRAFSAYKGHLREVYCVVLYLSAPFDLRPDRELRLLWSAADASKS